MMGGAGRRRRRQGCELALGCVWRRGGSVCVVFPLCKPKPSSPYMPSTRVLLA